MNITLNNLEQPSNLITFTDIPNILKVEDDGGGTKAELYIIVTTAGLAPSTTYDGQWYISFMGDTVSNVVSPNNAINKNFYISSSDISTAASLARAFRNCPTIAAYFSIENTTYNSSNCVKFTAKSIGPIWSNMSNYFQTNVSSSYISSSGTDGTSFSSLFGSKIDVDVYNGGEYVTTLEKNFYGSEVAFNISPVLTTFAEYGDALPYTLKLSSIVNGEYTLLGDVDTNYISVGYMTNQGNKYLFNEGLNIAQNFSRGTNKDAANNTLLYTYAPNIPISFYCGYNSGLSIIIDYLNSAYQVISSTTTTWRRTVSNKQLWDYTVELDGNTFNNAFYIDVTIGTVKIRYNVIKPIKATEYYQRILWRNSYGGISFFDFTGQKTESRDLEVSTYEKNIFDYYTDPMNELEKVYNNEVKYTVTLKSHLFENDGKYIFNDLLQSANVWTNINGQNYAIIIDSVNVDETDNNGVFEATLKYHYSQKPSLI